MKKIIIALLFMICGTASNGATLPRPSQSFHYGYNIGYHDGKTDAYNNVARSVAIVGMVVVASVMVYEIGRGTRWTANEKGVVYRF